MEKLNERPPIKGDASLRLASVTFLPEYGQIQPTNYFHKKATLKSFTKQNTVEPST